MAKDWKKAHAKLSIEKSALARLVDESNKNFDKVSVDCIDLRTKLERACDMLLSNAENFAAQGIDASSRASRALALQLMPKTDDGEASIAVMNELESVLQVARGRR